MQHLGRAPMCLRRRLPKRDGDAGLWSVPGLSRATVFIVAAGAARPARGFTGAGNSDAKSPGTLGRICPLLEWSRPVNLAIALPAVSRQRPAFRVLTDARGDRAGAHSADAMHAATALAWTLARRNKQTRSLDTSLRGASWPAAAWLRREDLKARHERPRLAYERPSVGIGPHAGDVPSQRIERVGGAGTDVEVVLAASAETARISASRRLPQGPARCESQPCHARDLRPPAPWPPGSRRKRTPGR